jgi:transcriptional regulator with XRE-family HTH domain
MREVCKYSAMPSKIARQDAIRIGSLVKAARLRAGKTLQSIAGPADVDYSQLSRIERGDFKSLSKNVQKICIFLDVALETEVADGWSKMEIARRAAQVAIQSSKNQRVLEAVLTALDESSVLTTESPNQ